MVELVGPSAALLFPCSAILRYLIMHIKSVDKFCSVDIDIIDDSKQYRTLNLSNKRSLASVQGERAEVLAVFGCVWLCLLLLAVWLV